MKYFKNIVSFTELKKQYRILAMQYHPDCGGDVEVMKAINNEYDQVFPIWKAREHVETNETASSDRSEFYTQNGWKGENYNRKLSLKDIAINVRQFIKDNYPGYKFSVRTHYASMCQELIIVLKEGPCKAYKAQDEWTEVEQHKALQDELKMRISYHFSDEEINRRNEKLFYTDQVGEAIKAVDGYTNSFNYSDCDGMIDYFDVNFYFSGVKVSEEYKVVESTKRLKGTKEESGNGTQKVGYIVTPDVDTRDNTDIWIMKFQKKVSMDEYKEIASQMKTIGGYYSRFKRGFLFRYDPKDKLAKLFGDTSLTIPA